jgi:hypothetical protein
VVQSWIRQALRASGVAILVPAAVVAAIALSVVGGGGGVGSLGQVLAGPAVPPAEAATQPASQPRRDERPRTRAGAVAARAVPAQRAPAGGRAPRPGRRVVTTVPERPHTQSARPPAAPAPSTAAPPPSAPPARPHPINDTGAQIAETVRPLPVAGPVAAGAVQAVVDLVDPPV